VDAALRRRGWRVLERNARLRGGELDVVAHDGEAFVFVEVRARLADTTDPSATVDARKLGRLLGGARQWLANAGCDTRPWRLVVASVTLSRSGEVLAITWIDDPFRHLPEFHRW